MGRVIRHQYQFLFTVLFFTQAGCSSSDDEDLGTLPSQNPCAIPVDDRNAMSAWVESEVYKSWAAESDIHDSTGPHFGNVRTWLSDELVESFESGSQSHPVCAATVKELYGDGQERRGWSVSVKVNEGRGPADWFWFELYDGGVLAGGTEVSVCVNCHDAGTDYVLTPFPLN